MAKQASASVVAQPAAPDFPFAELLRVAAYPHSVVTPKLKETQISWVVLTGEFAYKIKKPVHFDFIDASTLDLRRGLCEAEVRLNRRFAADLYLRVATITRDPVGLRIDGSGPVVEYAVCMRQFAADDELSELLSRGATTVPELAAFGGRLASLHQQADRATSGSPYGDFEEIRNQVLGNLATLLATLTGVEDLKLLSHLVDWTHTSLDALEPLIRLRRISGAVRECHGDLHARNIVRWQGELVPFDCLEFDPGLRWIDVASDVAFVFMDLMAYGRRDLAFAFLNGYLDPTGDFEGLQLLPFYAVYRALVRAKVDALSARHAPASARQMSARLASRLQVAAGFIQPAEPALIIMNGVTASGKSRVSSELTTSLGAVRVRSDLERKRIHGVEPLSHRRFDLRAGAYDEASSNRTYARLMECAHGALSSGLHVIVDGAFLTRSRRESFHAFAVQHHLPFLIVTCDAPRAELFTRLTQRAAAASDPSEATAAVLEDQLASRESLTAHETSHAIHIHTDRPEACNAGLAAVRAWIAEASPCGVAPPRPLN
ncbi:MAG: AAA family ATPase [Steroidobacteraceae bacterium]